MREIPKSLRIFFAAFPFVSLFFFPWPMTLIASLASGLVLPVLPVLVGILVDVFYLPGGTLPEGTLWGIGIAVFSYAVRYILKNRMM